MKNIILLVTTVFVLLSLVTSAFASNSIQIKKPYLYPIPSAYVHLKSKLKGEIFLEDYIIWDQEGYLYINEYCVTLVLLPIGKKFPFNGKSFSPELSTSIDSGKKFILTFQKDHIIYIALGGDNNNLRWGLFSTTDPEQVKKARGIELKF